jgi:dTDP-4-dehydrorhamnose 3,5-epimerase|tara:strand:+ start:3650 stop:4084 length:435 start_codon:yes stop_codon:yes gene_type:complete
MGKIDISNIKISALKEIDVEGGAVMHAMKKSDIGFNGFGEAYFSTVNPGCIKAWKLHTQMTMNLIVPIGKVMFAFIDSSSSHRSEVIGEDNYSRITVPPGIWFGFKGISSVSSIILNIASIEHSSNEIKRKDLDDMNFNWEVLN